MAIGVNRRYLNTSEVRLAPAVHLNRHSYVGLITLHRNPGRNCTVSSTALGTEEATLDVQMIAASLNPLPRWICVRLHLQSRISRRRPLQSIVFHIAGILRECTPRRGY
jgi:hypothetical protein